MKTIHFTDLAEYADRDGIERGARYLRCHDSRDRGALGLVGGAHCYEALTLTPIVVRRTDHDDSPQQRRRHSPLDPYWSKKHPFFQTLTYSDTFRDWHKEWHYASDSGLWNVEGVDYRNQSNYMLNINALLRQGIIIGTERIKP